VPATRDHWDRTRPLVPPVPGPGHCAPGGLPDSTTAGTCAVCRALTADVADLQHHVDALAAQVRRLSRRGRGSRDQADVDFLAAIADATRDDDLSSADVVKRMELDPEFRRFALAADVEPDANAVGVWLARMCGSTVGDRELVRLDVCRPARWVFR
jgi:hypothetical protein